MHRTASTDKQYHIQCESGDLAEYLLVPGDPDRVPKIARFWKSVRKVAEHREFRACTGKYKGVSISALSSGVGPACISIAVNEAANIGVKTFIRVGSTGSIQSDVKCGDVVISTAAVRLDATSNYYAMPEYPAVADYEVVLALIEAAENLEIGNYHVGITATTCDFYRGQDRCTPSDRVPTSEKILPTLQKVGVLNFEMETATLFTLASAFGLRAGSVCAVFANRSTGEFSSGAGEEDVIRIANEAVKILSRWDKFKERRRKRWLFPSLVSGK